MHLYPFCQSVFENLLSKTKSEVKLQMTLKHFQVKDL